MFSCEKIPKHPSLSKTTLAYLIEYINDLTDSCKTITYKLDTGVVKDSNTSGSKVGANQELVFLEHRTQVRQWRSLTQMLTYKDHHIITILFVVIFELLRLRKPFTKKKRLRKLTDEIWNVKTIGESAGGKVSWEVDTVRVVIGTSSGH